MAMAQLSATNGASNASAAPVAATSSSIGNGSGGNGNAPSRQEVQAALSQFDAKINQMGDFPAKDIINALTKLAERMELAQDIVSFLETKIHRVAPQFKLPIFYLTDSILKNVRGPYPSLFGRIIVPLYCNCVKQVSGKDLRRFIHVLTTWEQTRLFAADALAQMRTSANRAQALAEPSVMAQPASFAAAAAAAAAPSTTSVATSTAAALGGGSTTTKTQQQTDLELRALLTKLQNDMDIHPTEHMSLEEVRANNPAFYSQLLAFHAEAHPSSAKAVPVATMTAQLPTPVVVLPPGPVLGGPPPGPPRGLAGRQPPVRTGVMGNGPPPPMRRHDMVAASAHPRGPSPPPRAVLSAPPPKSANAAHLMQLLTRKQQAPSTNEVTNDPPRAPDAAAVMSILQKLKDLTQTDAATGPAPVPASVAPAAPPVMPHQPPPRGAMRMPPPPPPPAFLHGRPPPSQFLVPPPPPRNAMLSGPPPPGPPPLCYNSNTVAAPPITSNDNASRMWFSDTVVAHKERVESNVQKLYAALPLVCRDSGLRFKEQAQLNAHLDFLFQYNRSLKDRSKGGISRSWYPDVDQWVTDVASDRAPRESTSSSFFDRKDSDDDAATEPTWDDARVPVDESVTKCRICGESFAKSWDEDEEDWMYTNAVVGTIHDPTKPDGSGDYDTIFHKYCYEAVTANSKHITIEHLVPGTPLSAKPNVPARASATASSSDDGDGDAAGVKRALEDAEDSDSDEDVKRIRTD